MQVIYTGVKGTGAKLQRSDILSFGIFWPLEYKRSIVFSMPVVFTAVAPQGLSLLWQVLSKHSTTIGAAHGRKARDNMWDLWWSTKC